MRQEDDLQRLFELYRVHINQQYMLTDRAKAETLNAVAAFVSFAKIGAERPNGSDV